MPLKMLLAHRIELYDSSFQHVRLKKLKRNLPLNRQ